MNTKSHSEANESKQWECAEELDAFFTNHSLDASRTTLWKWLNVSASGRFYQLPSCEREELLRFYTHLQGLIEAVYHLKMVLDEQDRVHRSRHPGS